MPLVILHTDPATGIVDRTLPNLRLTRFPGKADQELAEDIARKDVAVDYPDGKGGFVQRPWVVADIGIMPHVDGRDADEDFRDAWRWNGDAKNPAVGIDMATAAGIGRKMLTAQRDTRLADLRLVLEKAQITGDAVTEATTKAIMRKLYNADAPIAAAIAKAVDLASLKAITLDAVIP